MKKTIVAAMVGAALFMGLAQPSQAWLIRNHSQIYIEGIPYEGTWAFIGSRPYVNVESFGKALGLPRVHNVKNWYLGAEGQPKGSPFQLAVETQRGVLPTVRFGGATFVDLQAACKALGIPYHWETGAETFQVGNPYEGQWMIGAWYRWMSNHYSWYNWGEESALGLMNESRRFWLYRDAPNWPPERRYPERRPRPYPDNYHNVDNYHSQLEKD